MKQHSTWAFLFTIQICLIIGCGSGGPAKKAEGTVSGTLTAAGTPLPKVMVNFQDPVNGSAGAALTNEKGEFQIDGAITAGSYKVFITPAPLMTTGEPGGPPPTVTSLTIPDKYKTMETTDLTAEVKAGSNKIPLDAK